MSTTHTEEDPDPTVLPREGVAATLEAAAGLLVSLASVGIFAEVWNSVHEPGRVSTAFDRKVLTWMHTHQSPAATRAATGLAFLGSPPLIVGIAAAGAATGLCFRRVRGAAWTLPVAVAGAGILIQSMKTAFHRPRPSLFAPLLKESGYSFPSGHSLIAIVVYGLLGAFTRHLFRGREARAAVSVLTASLVGSIGISRVYVGVHYPTDVLAGWTAGVPWLYTCLALHERLARRFEAAGESLADVPASAA